MHHGMSEFLSACTLDSDSVYAVAGCEVSDPLTGAVTPPIHFSTTFERDENLELSRGYNYARLGNPTRNLLETTFTRLENGIESFAFSSGMQAATSILMCYPNAKILLPDDLYHGVFVVLSQVFQHWGVEFEKIDMTDHTLLEQKLYSLYSTHQSGSVVVWLETPSNPLCKVTDVQFIAERVNYYRGLVAADNNSNDRQQFVVVVDSTWTTPYILKPLNLGADLVMHSTTKYIGGHSDMSGGIVVLGSSPAAATIAPRLRTVHQIGGGVCGPMESWLTVRGLRTLPLRMRQHSDNALALARFLETHVNVSRVFYPGLLSHPQHAVAVRQMGEGKYFSGMLSFLVKSCAVDSTKEALQVRNLKLCLLV